MPWSPPPSTPQPALWQKQSPGVCVGVGGDANETCCSPDSHPKPDQTVNCPGWASPLQAHRQDRRAGGQEVPWPRRQLKHSCHPAIQPGERLLAGSEGTAEESRGREAREGPEKVASVVARVSASRIHCGGSASGAKRPGEGRRGRGWEGEGRSWGSRHPGQEGWGLQSSSLALL